MKPIEIEVVVGEDGEVTLHVKGVKGKTCTDLTDEVEKALGRVTKRTATREAHEAPVQVKRCARH
jgi:hypothetical protein